MHYETLDNDKKFNTDMSNVAFQPSFQITEVNRSRTILLFLTTFQYVSYKKNVLLSPRPKKPLFSLIFYGFNHLESIS
jgi:hypothetical protein